MSAHESKSAEDLIEEHSGFVAQQAYGLALAYHVDADDLIQQGRLGIVRAMESYDPARGIKFLSYAKYWIFRKMQEWIWKTSGQVRVPPQKFGKLHLKQHSLQGFSELEEAQFEAVVANEETVRADANKKDIRRVLETAIAQLPWRQAETIRALYFEGLSDQQTSERHGITRAGVNLRKQTALKRLRGMKVIKEELAL